MTNWVTDGVKEEFKLTKNEEAAEGIEEYMINIELKADDEFKIVKPDGEEFVWYPAGENNNYKITSDGKYDIFFRPNADGGDDWYYNVIYVAKELLDMTDYIVNPSFETGDLTGWTVTSSDDTGVKSNSNATYTTAGCDGDYLFNTWWKGNPITQTVKDLPNGRYELRAKMTSDKGDHLYLLANGEHSAVFGSPEGKGVFVEQSMQFDVLDGTATIGAIGGNDDGSFNENGYFWYKADNFRLYFVEGVSLDKLVAAYEQALADAQAVTGDMNAEVKTALDAAIAANSEVDKTDADKLSAAIAALSEAAKAATASVDAYTKAAEILPKMKQLTESTNVYTQEAYDEYYGQWVAKYEAKTLTTDEASALEDPFLVTGWHAANTVDDFLLSAWPEANKTYADPWQETLYINTWSTEGESDGSDFKVPFFEYWTNDDKSLSEKTLTATMNGVEAGEYDVTAWVRVRYKNGAETPAYGISMQANDGEAVDVAAGDQVEGTQFYLKEFTATGVVGEDGMLNIKFIVAADNNISWLSFQNVKFAKKEAPANDFYLVGNMTEWKADEAYKLTKNEAAEGEEYMITLNLAANDEFKIAKSNGETIADDAWYPGGMNNNYKITQDGEYTIYFRPNGDGGEDWYYKYFFVAMKEVFAPLYALQEGDTFASGTTVEVKGADDEVLATITYGEAVEGAADFKAAKTDNQVMGYTAFTEGNGVNGNKTGGTFYTIVPVYDGIITVAVVLNANKAFYVEEDGTPLEVFNGYTVPEKYYGTFTFNVKADKSYKFYCTGSKLGFYGFDYSYIMPAPNTGYFLVGNMTDWKVNKDYKLAQNESLDGATEYSITLDLAADAQFKIAYSADGETIEDDAWYPGGMNNAYGENGELEKEGNYSVFFRPNADGGEDWFYNVIFAQYNGTVGIAGMKSEKNYQNDVIYTLNGQRVEKPRKGLYIMNGKKVVIK